jgi:excisionase family DNA binding protein
LSGPLAVGIEKAAEMVGLSKHTVRKYVSEQRILAVRIGRRVIIPVQSLEKLLREGAG